MKNAFTMIELVFVILVLGILSAVALPKLSGSVEDANIAVGISTVSSIRSAIASERQRSLILGSPSYPALLDDATENTDDEALFDGNASIEILQYPIYSGTESGDWMKTSANGDSVTYKYYIGTTKTATFTYTKADGKFDCNHSNTYCKDLTE
jgi:general secretion pathway protein G